MLPEKNFNSYEENLRMENELKKIKLTLEHGADFFYPHNQSELPPEIENQFLKNIEEFENAWHQSKQISVYEFIGKPDFRKCETIPDTEIREAKDWIMHVLHENQMSLQCICDVDDKELYRFITEELFLHEIDDHRLPGWNTCFIYEEFHPNHEYDIKDHSADFITSFLNKENDFYDHLLSENEETVTFLKNFRDSYEAFTFDYFRIDKLDFNTEKATLQYEISFAGIIEDSHEKQYFMGKGEMELVYKYEYWCIDKIRFPGNASGIIQKHYVVE